MRGIGKGDSMRRAALTALALGLIAALAVLPGAATAITPKPYSIYSGKYVNLQADQTGKSLASFNGYCTASKNSPYSFAVFFGIPVKKSGKFKWSGKNAVNTPDGGTLADTSLVTIAGKFTSKKKVSGTYQLHKGGCKKVKFKGKLVKN